MTTDEFRDIRYECDEDGIVTVVLDRPERRNAISALTGLELGIAARRFHEDDTALAMIITGADDPGRSADRQAFSSGGYFLPDAYEGLPTEVLDQIDFTDIAMKATVLAFFACDKPVLAAVNGLAIGGGFTLPLAVADEIHLSEHAWARLPFAELGISAELGSTYLLPRLLGMQRAKELLFHPGRLDAATLVELGLANAVVAHDELLDHVRERALALVPPRGAGAAIRAMKRIVHDQQREAITRALDLENEALNRLVASADFAEAMAARAERRAPVFRGR